MKQKKNGLCGHSGRIFFKCYFIKNLFSFRYNSQKMLSVRHTEPRYTASPCPYFLVQIRHNLITQLVGYYVYFPCRALLPLVSGEWKHFVSCSLFLVLNYDSPVTHSKNLARVMGTRKQTRVLKAYGVLFMSLVLIMHGQGCFYKEVCL